MFGPKAGEKGSVMVPLFWWVPANGILEQGFLPIGCELLTGDGWGITRCKSTVLSQADFQSKDRLSVVKEGVGRELSIWLFLEG